MAAADRAQTRACSAHRRAEGGVLAYRTTEGCRAAEGSGGDVGSARDVAALDRDATDGAGSEIVWIKDPEPVGYRVAVHDYNDHGYGSSEARVQVVVRGEVVRSLAGELRSTDTWWGIGEVRMPLGEVSVVDAATREVPPCP